MKVKFSGKLNVEYVNGNVWKLNQESGDPWSFTVNGVRQIVPRHGFYTDFASTPCFARGVMPKAGGGDDKSDYGPAAVAHDFLYSECPFGAGKAQRKYADDVFLAGLVELGVSRWRRMIMYSAVRAFGWKYYGKQEKLNRLRGVT